jgi:hypothetical protein
MLSKRKHNKLGHLLDHYQNALLFSFVR